MKTMTIDQIVVKLKEIRDLGFVPTMRVGNTGIGYTLETLFGIAENNVRTPDFGEIELKSQRKNISTPITLFTSDKGAWRIKHSVVIRNYGYVDKKDRQALKCFVTSKPNPQGLFTLADELELKLFHTSGVLIASWPIELILKRFSEKMVALVTVLAETRLDKDLREEFWFNEAYFLHAPSRENFVTALRQGAIVLDIRTHLKDSGAARNRGTAFRTLESDLPLFFAHREKLI
jgi:hypothetical protein